MSVCVSVCVSLCVSVCLFTFEVPFKHLFAPTSQSWMSKFLEIRNPWGKVVVSDINIFAQKLSKIAAAIFCLFVYIYFYFICSLLRYCLNISLSRIPEIGCPKFLELQNPWGKEMERSGLRCEHFCLKMILNCCSKKVFFTDLFFLCSLHLNVLFPHPPPPPPFPKSNVHTFYIFQILREN